MKKTLLILFSLFLINFSASYAEEITNESNEVVLYENIYQAVYNPETNLWSKEASLEESEIILTKKTIEGASTYSQLFYSDERLALTITSDFDFIKDGRFVGVDNNNLKFNEIIYNGDTFEEVPLSLLEIQKLFPDIELLRLSQIDADHKMWIHKPLFKKKEFLIVNDSDKSYYKLAPKMKLLQKFEIKGLITIPTYGFYTFTHFGEYKGKIRIYVR